MGDAAKLIEYSHAVFSIDCGRSLIFDNTQNKISVRFSKVQCSEKFSKLARKKISSIETACVISM